MAQRKYEELKSISSDTNFEKIDMDSCLYYAAQVQWSNGAGPFSGDLEVQGSLDGNNWETITGTTQSISGVSGIHIWDTSAPTALPFIRIAITSVSGSADLELDFNAKGWSRRS